MSDPKFILGVDLDGVCADFYAGLREIAADWLGVPLDSLPAEVTYGLPEWNLDPVGGYETLHRYAVTQRNLFRTLKPIQGAPVTLRRLSERGARIRIITHRLFIKHFHQQAVRQTIEWLDVYDVPYWDLCFLKDKCAVGADLYIEDSPGNVQALRQAHLDTIVFSNSTNRELDGPRADTWEEVEQQVLTRLERWEFGRSAGREASLELVPSLES